MRHVRRRWKPPIRTVVGSQASVFVPMPSSDEHRSKRPKTTLACDVCRHRKSRCDGARPKCSYCLNAGLDCIYRGPPTLDPTLGELYVLSSPKVVLISYRTAANLLRDNAVMR